MKSTDSYDKLRGGYYTPKAIADFISRWAIRSATDFVLEPSCGDGSFLEAARLRMVALGCGDNAIAEHLVGIELDSNEAQKACIYAATIKNEDFFTYYRDNIDEQHHYDVILGNPPFIRYQNFNSTYREVAFELMNKFGFHPNKLTNIWLPFLVLSSMALAPNGRIGMVIPAELFQVNYAAEARLFLSEFFDKLTLITFKRLIFDELQQEVILFLGEKTSIEKGIRVVELDGIDELDRKGQSCIVCNEIKLLDHNTEKWTKYYLTNQEIAILRKLQLDDRITPATELFEVNVGIVSGENDFFVANKSLVSKHGIETSVLPIISKSEQVKGIEVTHEDFLEAERIGKRVFLFAPDDKEVEDLSIEEQEYIAWGKTKEYHSNYKCRIRKRWYIVPKTWIPEAFILRQVNLYPRIILNSANLQVTDTLHKARFNDGISPQSVVCAFLNSYTLALSEITGRSYGGGVLTFEPGEIRKLRIPMRDAEQLDMKQIDSWVRKGEIQKVLDYTDNVLLKQALMLTEDEIKMLRNIWIKMRQRRLNRKSSFK